MSTSTAETPEEREAIVGDDGLGRCPWAATHPILRHYHDTEWGLAVRGERALYERISLEAFQSGLSWLTVLRKRPAFRAAFDDFDPEILAGYTGEDVERLMSDGTIIRNRAKIEAACTNARAVLGLREHEGLDELIWSHKPDEAPVPPRRLRGSHKHARLEGTSSGPAPPRLPVRRPDHRLRSDGSRRYGRHAPDRVPPPRLLGSVHPAKFLVRG